MTDIEIPQPNERKGLYRWFERAPFIMSLSVLLFPIILSMFSSFLAGIFVVAFVVIWFIRSVVTAVRAIQGFYKLEIAQNLDWLRYLKDIDNAEEVLAQEPHNYPDKVEQIHRLHLKQYLKSKQTKLKSKDVIHAIFIPTYNESYEVLRPTLEACVESTINTKKQAILIIPYEERAGPATKERAERLIKEYGDKFLYAEAIGHPDGLPGEVRGKGGNINFAAVKFENWLNEQKIDPQKILLTTLDADNRVHPQYFAAMSYFYLVTPARKHKSFQPVILYTNNIWDVPAVSRVLATGNSFWTVMQSLRPHLLRNFSSHAQPMDALIETNFWSSRTIVEDGHQFWRTYFAFDGKHDVVPVFVPIYQDAVLAEGYRRTLRAQFVQLRRWAWGCSDIAYVAYKGFFTSNKLPKWDLFLKLARLTDNHVSWATSALLIAFAAWAPLLLGPDGSDDIIAQQLPGFISRISTLSMIGIIITLYLMFKMMPNRPEHHGKTRYFWLLAQWILVPILGVTYGAVSSINAQTRLFLGKYLGFDVTEKAVKKVE